MKKIQNSIRFENKNQIILLVQVLYTDSKCVSLKLITYITEINELVNRKQRLFKRYNVLLYLCIL